MELSSFVCDLTRAQAVDHTQLLQKLWSDYGGLYRLQLRGAAMASVIAKRIDLLPPTSHPRGWQGQIGHARKQRSYQVELNWYRHYAGLTSSLCRVPAYLGCHQGDDDLIVVMEDLQSTGFEPLEPRLTDAHLLATLRWLAEFHARFMADNGDCLWPSGCYWHLETRQQELAAMDDGPLKQASAALDAALQGCRYQTLVHGDAKTANFLVQPDSGDIAAVDFQYVGKGVGVRDLAYLLGSALDDATLLASGERWLQHYLDTLSNALQQRYHWSPQAAMAVCQQWQQLYPLAWADFERFLQGWSPGHWKLGRYSARQTDLALAQLT
ncbi:Phosphotransferase enzyme family protein [Ferrimonas sediminum]|uniref:Phosphotransferase enzyme family protein n=1 Tax=Ferrimonas sediminum TaxID=718193 RepID=A0A1G8SFM9_9GAMM|nr:phosphotransferase [Ferrimonas sediminum]SDJ28062.1 Phosphotransferase enzyme family protein [Ferrimonas sediminum]